MGKIFYLMGKSSSGKDTIYRKVRAAMPELLEVVLYTTRPMRDGEAEGREYHFIGDEEFERLKSAGKLIEYREYDTVYGIWRYMTVDDGQIDLKLHSYFIIGTLESYEKTRAYFGAQALVPIYVTVEDGERLMRAIEREKSQKEPKYAEMCRRFLADEADFAPENLERNGITGGFENVDLDETVKNIISYIESEVENGNDRS